MAPQTILDAGVRSDLVASHVDTFAELGQPGDWLRAEERIALIEVVRAARAQAEQPPWYRPSSEHGFDPLPPAAVDAAWRLTNHPGTLTADWYAETVSELPSSEYYVELVGVVAVINAMDRLATMLDIAPLSVPTPGPGDPTEPSIVASVSSHWVPTAREGKGPMVLRALSVAPAAIEMRIRIGATHYMTAESRGDLDWSRGKLDRRQIELLAGVTSLHNECFY